MTSVRRFEDALRVGAASARPLALGESLGTRASQRVLVWLEARPGQSLLDLGCGSSDFLRCASTLPLAATGLEFSPEAAAVAQKCAPHAVVFIGTLQELPFEAAAYEYVTCLERPDNLPESSLDLAEIHRVLKPGGRACLVLDLESDTDGQADYPVMSAAQLPSAGTFGQWADELRHVGFRLLDAWPEKYLLRRRGFPRWGTAAWGWALKRRLWQWWPAWRRSAIAFLVEKPPEVLETVARQ